MFLLVVIVVAIILYHFVKVSSKQDAQEQEAFERMRGEEILRARAQRAVASQNERPEQHENPTAETHLTNQSTQKQPESILTVILKVSKRILLGIGVWFVAMVVMALIGAAIYPNGEIGTFYSLVAVSLSLLISWNVTAPKKHGLQAKGNQIITQEMENVAKLSPEITYPVPEDAVPTVPTKTAPEPITNAKYKDRTYRVAGISFREDNVENIGCENDDYHMTKRELIQEGMTDERIWEYDFNPIHAELVPEPTNPHDPNAIKVMIDGEHIGYIKAGSCTHVLKLIAEDRILGIQCEMGGGRYKYLSEEYDDEKEKYVYILEQDRVNYWASLSIRERID